MTRHTRVHTGEKPAACAWPGCSFATSDHSNLSRHSKTHTKERPFKCLAEGCNYAAAQKATLDSHTRRKHDGSRDHFCPGDGCRYAAVHEGDLRSHKKRCKLAAAPEFVSLISLLPRLEEWLEEEIQTAAEETSMAVPAAPVSGSL